MEIKIIGWNLKFQKIQEIILKYKKLETSMYIFLEKEPIRKFTETNVVDLKNFIETSLQFF